MSSWKHTTLSVLSIALVFWAISLPATAEIATTLIPQDKFKMESRQALSWFQLDNRRGIITIRDRDGRQVFSKKIAVSRVEWELTQNTDSSAVTATLRDANKKVLWQTEITNKQPCSLQAYGDFKNPTGAILSVIPEETNPVSPSYQRKISLAIDPTNVVSIIDAVSGEDEWRGERDYGNIKESSVYHSLNPRKGGSLNKKYVIYEITHLKNSAQVSHYYVSTPYTQVTLKAGNIAVVM